MVDFRLNRFLRSIATAIVVAALLVPSLASTVAAQSTGLINATTYVSTVTGDRYTWTSDWSYDKDNSSTDKSGETISLSSTSASVLFSYFPTGIDMDSARDQVLSVLESGADGFANVDRGSYDNVSYSLDKALFSGVELGVFTLFVERSDNVFVTVALAPLSTFAQGLSAAQSDIKINGAAIMDGVDPNGLQTALKNAPAVPTAAAKATEKPAPTRKPAPTEKPAPTKEAQATQRPAATAVVNGASTPAGDNGLISDGEYESPQFGDTVAWTSAWTIDDSITPPVSSDTKNGVDTLNLVLAGANDASNYGAVKIQTFAAGNSDTAASVVDYWTSSDYLDSSEGGSLQVLLHKSAGEEGGVVLLYTDDASSGQLVQYLSVVFLDGGKTAVVVELFATPDSIGAALKAAQDDLTLDGDPVLTLYTPAQVEKALP